jgi:hypothetical protein
MNWKNCLGRGRVYAGLNTSVQVQKTGMVEVECVKGRGRCKCVNVSECRNEVVKFQGSGLFEASPHLNLLNPGRGS